MMVTSRAYPSAVDMETEANIQAALETLMANRTTFIIAQRITSVLQADKILILENGRLVAEGTHAELLTHSPIYQEIYQSQLGDDAPDRHISAEGKREWE